MTVTVIENCNEDNKKYKDFVDKVISALSDYYGNDKRISSQMVRKNNNVVMTGITCGDTRNNIAPTIYMEPFYEKYVGGTSFSEIFKMIVEILDSSAVNKDFNVDCFLNYENVKKGLVYKLINKKKNEILLEDIPHIDYLDLAIVFYYIVPGDELDNASILIYNAHMDKWGISKETLYQDAKVNTEKLLPGRITNMTELMRDIIINNIRNRCSDSEIKDEALKAGTTEEQWMESVADEMTGMFVGMKDELPMYVLTNDQKLFGAGCMLYKNLIHEFASAKNNDVYILPSSVHEVIMIPDSDNLYPERLKEMVMDVNCNHVAKQEVLSDSVYYYSLTDDELRLAI